MIAVAAKSLAPVALEVACSHGDEPEAVARDLFFPSSVVQAALFTTVHTTRRRAPIPEYDRLVVLFLVVLNDEAVPGVVAIDRQSAPGVAAQPLEAVLAAAYLTEKLVAEVEDVFLVAHASRRRRGHDRPSAASS